jgi:hypothetical protein
VNSQPCAGRINCTHRKVNIRTVLEVTGFVVLPGVISQAQCQGITRRLEQQAGSAGDRNLLEESWCSELAVALRDTIDLGAALTGSVAVQCTYFEKSEHSNWLVPLHQDLSIPVQAHVDATELTGWSMKQGTVFVQPPASVVENLTAVRVHLDDSTEDNGPLRVVPGSHRAGRLRVEEQRRFRDLHGEMVCTTPRGSVIAMKPLLLHASSKATSTRPRRVLHYLYGPRELPYGLAWARAV